MSRRSKLVKITNSTCASTTSSVSVTASASWVENSIDLLMQILMLLPIDTLLKFKRVSKHWHSLISSHNFTKLRTPFPTSPSGLFLRTFSSLYHTPCYDFINFCPNQKLSAEDPSDIKILQSCNGLFLCSTSLWLSQKDCYFLYNPTTNQRCKIPPPHCEGSEIVGVSLAFDPSKSPHYKVVCVSKKKTQKKGTEGAKLRFTHLMKGHGEPRVVILSLLGGTNIRRGVFCNGAIHWLTMFESNLMSFNVDEEKVRDTPLPQKPDNNNHFGQWRTIYYFGACRDQLHLIVIYGRRTLVFDVFEMAKDYSTWFVKYHVNLIAVSFAFPRVFAHTFSVLCVVQGEVGEDPYLVLNTPRNVVRYNFKDKTFYKLCDISGTEEVVGTESTVMMDYTHAYQYIESLYCL